MNILELRKRRPKPPQRMEQHKTTSASVAFPLCHEKHFTLGFHRLFVRIEVPNYLLRPVNLNYRFDASGDRQGIRKGDFSSEMHNIIQGPAEAASRYVLSNKINTA